MPRTQPSRAKIEFLSHQEVACHGSRAMSASVRFPSDPVCQIKSELSQLICRSRHFIRIVFDSLWVSAPKGKDVSAMRSGHRQQPARRRPDAALDRARAVERQVALCAVMRERAQQGGERFSVAPRDDGDRCAAAGIAHGPRLRRSAAACDCRTGWTLDPLAQDGGQVLAAEHAPAPDHGKALRAPWRHAPLVVSRAFCLEKAPLRAWAALILLS